ncbi:uncharacterized protein isoform X2 [Leptinotarsa decemlineata]|uniref:uncharacterized protein isoform X2 n=1 Tax=Leptinotarsa decemlineata TaxID=7539 RepID=UPI003D3062C9
MMTGKLEKRISLELKESLLKVNKHYMNLGCNLEDLEKQCTFKGLFSISKTTLFFIPIFMSFLLYELDYFVVGFNYLLGVRCIVPNNYFIWEATRPITDCNFCSNTLEPIILSNITKNDFLPYAYSSKPIVIKRAFLHWPAIQIFTLEYFQNLYRKTEDSFKSVDEECQFLHFKSDFMSLRDVLSMSKERSKNSPSEKSWYVGWGNCHPVVLEKMRKHYPKPHFLPDDCEIPSKEYVFMGYDDGATMHAQLKGSKVWNLHPPPECESICKPFSFMVEPGDAVLVDTRIWYHGTTINPGEFSLSVQSEYG